MTDIRAPDVAARRAGPAGDDERGSGDAGEGGPAAPPGPWLAPATGPRTAGRSRRARPGWRLVLVLGALVGAVGFLVYQGIGSSLDYYVTVGQALGQRSSLAGRTFRLQGIVVPRTVDHHGTTVAFSLAQPGDERLQVAVVDHGQPPQLFKVGIPVIVQGRFDGATFVSSQLIVDHTGNYLPQRDGPRSAAAPTATGS